MAAKITRFIRTERITCNVFEYMCTTHFTWCHWWLTSAEKNQSGAMGTFERLWAWKKSNPTGSKERCWWWLLLHAFNVCAQPQAPWTNNRENIICVLVTYSEASFEPLDLLNVRYSLDLNIQFKYNTIICCLLTLWHAWNNVFTHFDLTLPDMFGIPE